MALTPAQQTLIYESASEPWCLPAILEVSAATGARRGEILALRWSDLQDGRVEIARSLTQTQTGPGVQRSEDRRQRSRREPSGVGPQCSRRTPQAATGVPPAVRFRLPDRSGFDIRESRRHTTEARFDFGIGVGAVPAPETTEGSQPAHPAPQSWVAPAGGGMEITAVSERLGHSSVRVTADVYSHAIRGRDDEAARRWEAFQGRNLPEKQTGVQ
jgi:integrase